MPFLRLKPEVIYRARLQRKTNNNTPALRYLLSVCLNIQ